MSPKERKVIGEQSIAYVNKYHSPEYVGRELSSIIQRVLKHEAS